MRFEADDSCNELFCCHWVWQDLALAMIDGPGAPHAEELLDRLAVQVAGVHAAGTSRISGSL